MIPDPREHRRAPDVATKINASIAACHGLMLVGERGGWLPRFYRGVGCCRACQHPLFPDCTDESETFTRQCLDEALLLARIADRAPGDIQAGRQRRIGDDTPIPNGVDEVVFTDDTLPVADQVVEQVEYLWRDGDDICSAMQLAPVSVECVLLEEIAQAAIPLGGLRSSGL